MPNQWVTKLSFWHLQLDIFDEKGVIRIEEEKFRLPVDVRGWKTSVLKLSIVAFSNFSGVEWKENIWYIFRVKFLQRGMDGISGNALDKFHVSSAVYSLKLEKISLDSCPRPAIKL